MTLSMDILPTVARLAGTSEPQDRIIDGRDAYALWTGDADVQSPHSAYFYYSNEELQAVRSGDWKLHVIRADWQAQGFEKSDYYLFNLREDISESTNLAAKHPEIVEQLKRLIDDARVDLGDSAVPAAVGQGIRMAGLSELPPSPFVPESLERLAPDSELRETILESLHAATPLAYKMRGWEWGQPEGHSLKLDAWWPLGSGPWPIVIWIHGEHDGQGFKEMLEHPARRVAAEGFACVCIDYRPSTDDLLSADLQDCLSAINWVQREAARIHGDPTRIAIVGESSGGKLALLAAYGTAAEQPAHAGFSADSPAPWVQAVIAIDSFGDANTLDAAQLDAHDPPTLLISGGQRELASQTREIQHLLTSHAIPHEVLRLNDASPGFMVRDWNSESSRRAVDEVVRFLKQAFP
jgi:acetyl esterase/lipase